MSRTTSPLKGQGGVHYVKIQDPSSVSRGVIGRLRFDPEAVLESCRTLRPGRHSRSRIRDGAWPPLLDVTRRDRRDSLRVTRASLSCMRPLFDWVFNSIHRLTSNTIYSNQTKPLCQNSSVDSPQQS